MKRKDVVVNGKTSSEARFKLVAGLRLLRAYGRLADRALKALESDGRIQMTIPFLERRGHVKGSYEISKASVHRRVPIPVLPDFSSLNVRLDRAPDKSGFLLYVTGPGFGVYPGGRVTEIAVDAVFGSAWARKTRVSWSFNNDSSVKAGKSAVTKSIARACSHLLVKLVSDGVVGVKHSKAKQVHSELRARAEARILLDGHAGRVFQTVEGLVTVEDVHAR